MGMFDELKVVGADREKFKAPWGTVYDDFQTKHLCALLYFEGQQWPDGTTYVLEESVIRVDDESGRKVTGSGVVHVYAFANGDQSRQSVGWVEWALQVDAGRVVAVDPVVMDPGEP